MKMEDFVVKQEKLRRYDRNISWLLVAGCVVFMISYLVFSGRGGLNKANWLIATFVLVYCFGGTCVCLWLKVRRQKQLGAVCPKCGKLFLANQLSESYTAKTGKCRRCGEVLID